MLEKFTWYKQSAYKWKGEGITVYIDPWGLRPQEEPADVIFITHAHADHYEPADVKKIKPQLAVPNHYGFVVGVASDAETFAREAAPVKVQVLKPVNAFERTGAAAR